MDDLGKIVMAIFGGIIVIAIVSVVVGRKSQAPAAIQSLGTALSSVVAAAVNPVSAASGFGGGAQVATTPSLSNAPFIGDFGSMSNLMDLGSRLGN